MRTQGLPGSTSSGAILSKREARRFVRELDGIRAWLESQRGPEDVRHLRKVEAWGRLASVIGYGTAWMGFHPVAWVGIALGISCRWMMIAHHVLHRGYDRCEGAPPRFRSETFARGFRRWIDWCDWLDPKAWQREHNSLHHYRLGEVYDPDVPERAFCLLARLRLPAALKIFVFWATAMIWKGIYYGPNILVQSARSQRGEPPPYNLLSSYIWNPLNPLARKVWTRSWLPYLLVRFGLMPLPFLALGQRAWLFVIANTLMAEILTNLHCFVVIVTNHAGSDIPRFAAPCRNADERLLRQIAGSVNFRTGGDANDFLHGWLNYQIEHHIWPDLTLRQYQLAQPRVKELCERFQVPYLQESVFRRVRRLMDNAIGKSPMTQVPSLLFDA
jgi:fatty acid desaturase